MIIKTFITTQPPFSQLSLKRKKVSFKIISLDVKNSAFKEMKYCFLHSMNSKFNLGNFVSVKVAFQLGTTYPHDCKNS